MESNTKTKIIINTFNLNKLLHKHAIYEKLRSQFIGTCLLVLKNGLNYQNLTLEQLFNEIKKIVENVFDNEDDKEQKINLLYNKVFESQNIRSLSLSAFIEILDGIKNNILPFVGSNGQDLLNFFFITLNKYVSRADKNQVFTPAHITDFMAKIAGVNYKSRVLDICCGSGAFLVRALTKELKEAPTEKDKDEVRKNNIFGIEYEENIFGLALTNMLINGGGTVINKNCFDAREWIINTAKPNIILMNPPFNCASNSMDKNYVKNWSKSTKEDPSKGLYFVKWLADIINEMGTTAVMAIILPLACAIGTGSDIKKIKAEILKKNTIDAVFSLPNDIFHPAGAASSCCMVFKLGIPNKNSAKTFFGYYKEDGFVKKKQFGRIEQIDGEGKSKWDPIEEEWINLYKNREIKPGKTAEAYVSENDEWLCEAYMETDYSTISDEIFQTALNNFLAYQLKEGKLYEP